MSNHDHVNRMRALLETEIKLDVAAALREHPELDEAQARAAFDKLTSASTLDGMVRDLARDELRDAIAGGDTPTALSLMLAGFIPNRAVDS